MDLRTEENNIKSGTHISLSRPSFKAIRARTSIKFHFIMNHLSWMDKRTNIEELKRQLKNVVDDRVFRLSEKFPPITKYNIGI